MRSFTTFLLGCFGAALTACDNVQPVTLGEPVIMDLPGGMSMGPRLSYRHDGRLVLSWLSVADLDATLTYATIENQDLSKPVNVVTDAGMFVNWADLPSVLHVEGRHWLAHWLRYSSDKTYSYDVVVSQSFDDGKTWSDAVAVHDDGTPTEHGFVSMHRTPGGIALLWLDGRNTPEGPMTLRSGVITPAGEVTTTQLVDESVCDCCQTDVAVSSHGPIAAYRDRTGDEIRDIFITRHIDGDWQPGTRLHPDNWQIGGCPVNGPSIVAAGDIVAIAWFTGANDNPAVRVKVSTNGGTSFGAPIEISAGRIAGYVGLAFIDGENLAVSWVARNPTGGNSLMLRTIAIDGRLGEVRRVAEIAQLRVFPQLGYQDGHLVLFWTDQAGGIRELRGAIVPVR